MAGGGRIPYQPVKASDPLPTADAIALARAYAARACAERAAQCAWPRLAAAHAWIDRIPVIALAALHAACPEIAPERLARCLGLDPVEVPTRLESARRRPAWPEDLVNVVAQQIAGGL